MNLETNESVLLTQKGKEAFLKALNERFYFHRDGKITPRSDKANEPIILSEYMDKEDDS